MNQETTENLERPVWHIGIMFAAAGFLFIALVAVVEFSAPAPRIDAARADLVSKALFEIRTNEAAALNTAGWADESRGIVRLPVATAMQMTESAWKNPAAARAGLVARAEKAANTAPKVIKKTSAFE